MAPTASIRSCLRARATIMVALALTSILFLYHANVQQPVYTNNSPPPTPNKPLTTQQRLKISEGVYQNHVKARNNFLEEYGYGSSAFDPWNQNPSAMPWWWYFQPAFQCPHDVQRVGIFKDGGKWVCGLRLLELQKKQSNKKCVIYSIGVAQESTFEDELLKRTDCEIWAFDGSINEVTGDVKNNPRLHFNKIFVGNEDKLDEDQNVWKTLKTIMKENGHDWIDILKIDIEGYEFEVLDHFMAEDKVLPFGQLQLEIHLDRNTQLGGRIPFKDYLEWWQRLEKHQLRPFWSELNLVAVMVGHTDYTYAEYSFINLAGDHLLLHD